MAEASHAASIQVPFEGWVLFGGNTQKTSQKLANVNSNWEAGPAVQVTGIHGQCAVQVMKNSSHKITHYLP
jgi:hypothetical protein